jgi:hypothetical protein
MKIPFLSFGKSIVSKGSRKENAAEMSSESISDMLNRLRRYNNHTKSYKIDVLSIPHALQMVLKLFPHKYCSDRNLKERILRAFVTTVIPGADKNDEFLVKMYEDVYYPFHTYCGYFIFDLNRRSKKLFGVKEFNSLSLKKRTMVIQNALSGKELTVRLYKGAILMSQVAYFGAVYNEEEGCKLIDFPGRNKGYEKEEITYSFADEFFSNELSFDGHPW